MSSTLKRKRAGPNHTIKVEDLPADVDQYDADLDEFPSDQGSKQPLQSVLRTRKGIIQTPEDLASILSKQTSGPSNQKADTHSPPIEEEDEEKPAKRKKDQVCPQVTINRIRYSMQV